MRKILTFLAVIVVCAGCKNYQADIDNYLSYWSTQATIARYSFDPAAVQTDNEKIQNIPSSSDVNVILTVRNPKNFTFKMPQNPGAPADADIVVFPTDVAGTAGGTPTQSIDYTLTQDSSSQLRLTYKKEFLQKYEYGAKNIGPTITLYAADSRPFPGTFKLNVKVNTPPPNLTYRAIGKTTTAGGNGKQYYVLFLEANGMDTTINGSNLLHKDIRYLSIAEGSGTYTSIPLTVKADKSGFDISGAGGRLLAHTKTAQLAPSDVGSGVPPDILPASTEKWILCVKTNVEVKSANKKEYRFLLQDEAGLRSTVALHAFTSANDKINPTNTQKISGGQGAWKKLKAAVAAAEDGDVIIIDGTITATSDSGNNGEIAVTKSITIRGKSGNRDTDILNANGTNGSKPAHRIFKVTDCDLTLEGLTLKGGMATDTSDYDKKLGGGIYGKNIQNLTIKNCIIKDCEATTSGGGIYVTAGASGQVNGTLTLKDGVRISTNSAQKGGGIAVENAKLIIEAGCAIGGEQLYTGSDASKPKGNWTTSSGCGGGIYVGKKAECTIKEGVKIQYNSADSGGGIYVDSSDSATAPDKGELIVEGTAANPVVISNCVVTGSSSSGGGIYSKGKVTLEYAKLEHNKAQTNGQGGGIYINKYAGACELDNTTITDCEAANAGGGVCISNNSVLTLRGSSVITPSSGEDKGKNDVYLVPYAYISIDGILSAPLQVARISMADDNYNAYNTSNSLVLQGDLQQGTPHNYSKFTVTPQQESGATKFWQINNEGKLESVP